VIRETGVRVLGPNTSGLISTPHRLVASFFPLGGKVPRGNVSYMHRQGISPPTRCAYHVHEHYGRLPACRTRPTRWMWMKRSAGTTSGKTRMTHGS